MTEDKMVRWRHQLDGHELEQAPGVYLGGTRRVGGLLGVAGRLAFNLSHHQGLF